MKEMICIVCPLGCHLSVDDSNLEDIKVTGNTCPRGAKYAKEECVCPKRMVTSVVKVNNGEINMVSVKTSNSIEKSKIFEALELLNDVVMEAPVRIGDVVLSNILGTGVDIIATKNVDKK